MSRNLPVVLLVLVLLIAGWWPIFQMLTKWGLFRHNGLELALALASSLLTTLCCALSVMTVLDRIGPREELK